MMHSNWKKLMAATAALSALLAAGSFAQPRGTESERQQGATADDDQQMNMMTMMGRMDEMMEKMDRMMEMCNDMMARTEQERTETPAEGDAE